MLIDLRQYKSYLETEMTSGLTNSNDYNEWQKVRSSIRSSELYIENATIKALVDGTLQSADGYSFNKKLEKLDAYMEFCVSNDTCLSGQSDTNAEDTRKTGETDPTENIESSNIDNEGTVISSKKQSTNMFQKSNTNSENTAQSSSAGGGGSGESGNSPPTLGGMFKMIERIFKYIFPVAGLLCVIFIVQGGYMWMTSSGEPEKIKQAQGTLTWAIIGLVFVIISSSILSAIVRLIE